MSECKSPKSANVGEMVERPHTVRLSPASDSK
jgi:hypothetical protein